VVTQVGSGNAAAPTELFFSEYIEGSSNNKALEIYNGTGSSVNLATGAYDVQMFFNGNPTAGLTIALTGTVADGDVYVLAQSSANATILAQADQTNGSGWFNGDDAVVLRKGGVIVDSIGQAGIDPGTEWGTGLTSTADNTLRRKATITAGDPTSTDAFDPAVEWDGFATDTFGGLGAHTVITGTDAPPSLASSTPSSGAREVALDANVTLTFSEPVSVAGSWFSLTCSTSGVHTAAVAGGPTVFTLDPDSDFVMDETCTVTVSAAQVTDLDGDDPPDAMAADASVAFATVLSVTPIHDIQGAAHLSPLAGSVKKTQGIVTALRPTSGAGFYLQDPSADADDATSEAIFVFTGSAPTVLVGDEVQVVGNVTEFRPGGSASTNLTTTELTAPSVSVLSSGNAAPPATVVGTGGRVPPGAVIDDDATGSVETSGTFDASTDGIDFYESLEGMRVQVNAAVAVGPTSAFGEIPIVGDGGADAAVRTSRGGVVIAAADFNPERIHLDDTLMAVPVLNVGDSFTTPVEGVLDYSFGNFKLNVTTALTRIAGPLAREVTAAPTDHQIAVATYNVENLDPSDTTFARHAEFIVDHLRSPDLIAIEEIQDSDGASNTAVTDATATWNQLIAAIVAKGGPTYQFRQIDPVDDADGGQPGGNIRVGFLFRTDRELEFIARPGGTSTSATTVIDHPSGPRLSASPGRIDPGNAAFDDSRKPLVGEFRMRGKKVFVIANHFASKGGDHPLFGRFQPPVRSSEVQRHAQAAIVNAFVDDLVEADPNVNVIVLGDINDFEFSETVEILEGDELTSLMNLLPKPERYSYVFEGNSQVLDQILVSDNITAAFPVVYDVVHVNSEFADQASDHEPQVARIDFRGRPAP
jgi:hypothetical protein